MLAPLSGFVRPTWQVAHSTNPLPSCGPRSLCGQDRQVRLVGQRARLRHQLADREQIVAVDVAQEADRVVADPAIRRAFLPAREVARVVAVAAVRADAVGHRHHHLVDPLRLDLRRDGVAAGHGARRLHADRRVVVEVFGERIVGEELADRVRRLHPVLLAADERMLPPRRAREPDLGRHRLPAMAGVAGHAGTGDVRRPGRVEMARHAQHHARRRLAGIRIRRVVVADMAEAAAFLRRDPRGDRFLQPHELRGADVRQHLDVPVACGRGRTATRDRRQRRRNTLDRVVRVAAMEQHLLRPPDLLGGERCAGVARHEQDERDRRDGDDAERHGDRFHRGSATCGSFESNAPAGGAGGFGRMA